eukprot:395821-Amphidinium_carterae.2
MTESSIKTGLGLEGHQNQGFRELGLRVQKMSVSGRHSRLVEFPNLLAPGALDARQGFWNDPSMSHSLPREAVT